MNSHNQRVAVIAAAGRGTRFGLDRSKVLADVHGRPCVRRVLDAVEHGLGEHRQIIVVGHQAEAVREAIGEAPHRVFVDQQEPRGTGHALMAALEAVGPSDGDLYFFCGDKPLLRGATVAEFRQQFSTTNAAMLFLTGRIEGDLEEVRTSRQGRVVCVPHDGVPHALAIVERKVIDAIDEAETYRLCNGALHRFTRQELLSIRDVNVSTYAWRIPLLRELIRELSDQNAQQEYLVTDLVQIFLRYGLPVQTLALKDSREGKGIDTLAQLQEIMAL